MTCKWSFKKQCHDPYFGIFLFVETWKIGRCHLFCNPHLAPSLRFLKDCSRLEQYNTIQSKALKKVLANADSHMIGWESPELAMEVIGKSSNSKLYNVNFPL